MRSRLRLWEGGKRLKLENFEELEGRSRTGRNWNHVNGN